MEGMDARVAVTAALLAIALSPSLAHSDGLPIAVDVDAGGVPASDGSVRFASFNVGQRTVVAKIAQRGGPRDQRGRSGPAR